MKKRDANHPVELFDVVFYVGNNIDKLKKIQDGMLQQGVDKKIIQQNVNFQENKVNDVFVGQGVNQAALMIAQHIIEGRLGSALIIEENCVIDEFKKDFLIKRSIQNILEKDWEVMRFSYDLCSHIEDSHIQIENNFIKLSPRQKRGYVYGTGLWAISKKGAIKMMKNLSKTWNQCGDLIEADESFGANKISPNILPVWLSKNMENYLHTPPLGFPGDKDLKEKFEKNYKNWRKEFWNKNKKIIPKTLG
jgi:hypothetical protein